MLTGLFSFRGWSQWRKHDSGCWHRHWNIWAGRHAGTVPIISSFFLSALLYPYCRLEEYPRGLKKSSFEHHRIFNWLSGGLPCLCVLFYQNPTTQSFKNRGTLRLCGFYQKKKKINGSNSLRLHSMNKPFSVSTYPCDLHKEWHT